MSGPDFSRCPCPLSGSRFLLVVSSVCRLSAAKELLANAALTEDLYGSRVNCATTTAARSRVRRRCFSGLVTAALVGSFAVSANGQTPVELTGNWKLRVCFNPAARVKEPRLQATQEKTYDVEFGNVEQDGSVMAAVKNFPGTLTMIANFENNKMDVSKFFVGNDAGTQTRSRGNGFLIYQKNRLLGSWKTTRGADGQWVMTRTSPPSCGSPDIQILAPAPPRRGKELTRAEFRNLVLGWWDLQDATPFQDGASWGTADRMLTVAWKALKGVQVDPEFLADRERLGVGSAGGVTGLTIDDDEYKKLRAVGLTQYPAGWLVLNARSGAEVDLTAAHEAIHFLYFALGTAPDVDSGVDVLNELTATYAPRLTSLRGLGTDVLRTMVDGSVRAEWDWPEVELRFQKSTSARITLLEPYTHKPWSRFLNDFLPRVGGAFDIAKIRTTAEKLVRDSRTKAEADRGTLSITASAPSSLKAGDALSGSAKVTLLGAPANASRFLIATVAAGSGAPLERRLGSTAFVNGAATIDLSTFGARVPSDPAATIRVSVRFAVPPEARVEAAVSRQGCPSPSPSGGRLFVVVCDAPTTTLKPSVPPQRPFGRPQYLIHVTERGSATGTEKVDYLAVHADQPDGKGSFVAPDGFGGTRGYGSDWHAGPFNTAAEVCAAAGSRLKPGESIGSFTSSADTVRCS